MTEEEFRKEARQIAIAFDLPSDFPAKVTVDRNETFLDDVSFGVELKTEDFEIWAGFSEPENEWAFMMDMLPHKMLSCYGWPTRPQIHWERNKYPQRILILVRAMHRLGFDVSLVEARFSLAISAHEKLEWQLEFARRMREDARENGE